MPTLGVIGTLVWDRIHQRDGHGQPVEEWGGIAYALAAVRAAAPAGWDVLPIIKVGRDLSEPAFHFLREIPGLGDAGLVVVPEPNNRVELRYLSRERRTERLSGGVPAWTWPELAPIASLCDALYVNFISGFEMELEGAWALRQGFDGPIYADLHSLFLGMSGQGDRVPRTLEGWADWLRCFDAVQVNEDEFELLGRHAGDPWRVAAQALGPDLKLIAVTMGSRGAAYVVGHDFHPDPARWRDRPAVTLAGPARSRRVPVDGSPPPGDPTGCGDVWGGTLMGRLLAGDALETAMGAANVMAVRNLDHRGARGLYHHLIGRLSTVKERV